MRDARERSDEALEISNARTRLGAPTGRNAPSPLPYCQYKGDPLFRNPAEATMASSRMPLEYVARQPEGEHDMQEKRWMTIMGLAAITVALATPSTALAQRQGKGKPGHAGGGGGGDQCELARFDEVPVQLTFTSISDSDSGPDPAVWTAVTLIGGMSRNLQAPVEDADDANQWPVNFDGLPASLPEHPDPDIGTRSADPWISSWMYDPLMVSKEEGDWLPAPKPVCAMLAMEKGKRYKMQLVFQWLEFKATGDPIEWGAKTKGQKTTRWVFGFSPLDGNPIMAERTGLDTWEFTSTLSTASYGHGPDDDDPAWLSMPFKMKVFNPDSGSLPDMTPNRDWTPVPGQ